MSDVKRYECLLIEDAPRLQAILPQGAVVCSARRQMMVTAEDYAKLEAEAQALREEVAALRARVVVVPERYELGPFDTKMIMRKGEGRNACLDELARLNGKAVSEGLLRDIYLAGWQASGEGWNEEYPGDAHNRQEWKDNRDAAIKFLLGEGNEHD
ncbi:hypothetical protein [Pseudomonas aeruginosa]|uniref:hypothetical protein n=1 Tax=Pseudomonas aeruginosa TaxID=287 RepID=UPI000AD49F70|nr:hypothetical protein [Pseudomonas aeruginosa]